MKKGKTGIFRGKRSICNGRLCCGLWFYGVLLAMYNVQCAMDN